MTGKAPPPEVLAPPGLIGDIAKWIDACAVHPAPLLSVASALSVVSTLAGRRYSLPSGLRTCTYVVGVAGSGVGKEVGRQCAMSLLDACGLAARIGTGGIASGAGLVQQLVQGPTRLFLLDEFGRLLESFSSKNAASHEREIMTTFMQLWSSAPGVYIGKAYAERDTPVVQMPHTVLYGTTTPDAFYASLKGRDIVDGVMSRMLVMEVDHGQLDEVAPTAISGEPPATLVERCKQVAAGMQAGNLAGLETSTVRETPFQLTMDTHAQAYMKVRSTGLTAQINAVEHGELWVRAKEQTLRVALACAVGRGAEVVALDDVRWAWHLVRWSTMRIDEAVNARVAETDEGRCCLAMLAVVMDLGGCATATAVSADKRMRRFDASDRKRALARLVDEERLAVEQSSVPAPNGKRPTLYMIPEPAETEYDES